MKKQLIYILFFIGLAGFSQVNPVSIETDTTTIKIGEQIQYKILVNETSNVIFPKLQLDSLGKVEVVESLQIDTLKNKLEKTYLLTSFDSGQYILPKQQVLINSKFFFTDSLLVNVAKVKVDTTKQKMFPIKSIKREPKTFDDYKHLWWWIIPILLLLAIILYVVFRKREKKEIVKVYIAPIQEALQRLKELDEKQLLQQNKIKAYYTELTDIVRTYIEKDISIPALESTTNELIETIIDFNESSNLGISKETIQQLKEVLQGADLVKFAKSKPLIEEIRSDRNVVEEILKNTQIAVHEKEEEQPGVDSIVLTEKLPKKKKNALLKYIIAFAVFFIIGIGIAGYFAYTYVNENVFGDTTSEMMDKQWYSSLYGYPGIAIETPEILKIESVQLPENVMSVVGDFSIYTNGSLISDFYIAVSTTNFIIELKDIDINSGVQGSLKEMESKLGVNFTNFQQKEIVINGIIGKKVQVDYKRLNQLTQKIADYKLTILFFADKKGMRQVLVSYLADDFTAKNVSDRILKSVFIKP